MFFKKTLAKIQRSLDEIHGLLRENSAMAECQSRELDDLRYLALQIQGQATDKKADKLLLSEVEKAVAQLPEEEQADFLMGVIKTLLA